MAPPSPSPTPPAIDPFRLSAAVSTVDTATEVDPVVTELLEGARRLVDVFELVSRLAGYYRSKAADGPTFDEALRLHGGTMTAAEVLRLIEGDTGTLTDLRTEGAPTLTLDELPDYLGGRRP